MSVSLRMLIDVLLVSFSLILGQLSANWSEMHMHVSLILICCAAVLSVGTIDFTLVIRRKSVRSRDLASGHTSASAATPSSGPTSTTTPPASVD